MKLKDLPKVERPRERLIAKGAENLKDAELLAILLRTGREGKNVLEVASQILSEHSKKRLLQLKYEDLIKVKGINAGKATTLLAAFELSKRALDVDDSSLPVISNLKEALSQLTDIRQLQKEHFVALYLNARNQLVHKETISIGTLNASLIHPREVFELAIQHRTVSVVVSHNHPSGTTDPSEDDIEVTKRLVGAGKLLGIDLYDHIIVTKSDSFSFRKEHLI